MEPKPPFSSREEPKARGFDRETLDLYDLRRVPNLEAQELAARLPAVFGDPPRPRVTLSVARGYDDEWSLPQEREAQLSARDPEQHWTEVTAEAARTFQEYFSFSDAEGWRFYLPAFLRQYLAEFPLCSYDAVFHACVGRAHFKLITPEQTAFVDEIIALCRTWDCGY